MRKAFGNINWRGLLHASLWCITLLGLGFLMSFIKVKSEEMACINVEVIIPGEQSFIARQDVDQLIAKTQGELKGKTLNSIPIHELEQDLRAIPFVQKAIVTQDMSGVLKVKIKQREAVLRVINQFGHDFYIDQEGVKMPLSAHYAPRVLVVNGWVTEQYGNALDSIQTPMLHDLYDVANFIAADTLWNNQIEQLYVNASKQIEMVPRVGDQSIVLGNAQGLEEKFKKLLIFYREVVPSVGWDAYQRVDLSFANQLVCTRRGTNNKENNYEL